MEKLVQTANLYYQYIIWHIMTRKPERKIGELYQSDAATVQFAHVVSRTDQQILLMVHEDIRLRKFKIVQLKVFDVP